MKTWQAALAQLAATLAQATLAIQFFDSTNPTGIFANAGIQLGAQTALSALQVWVASKNSNTDPKGNKLVQTDEGKYITTSK